MKKIILSAIVLGALSFAGIASAACTVEEAQKKAEVFAQKAIEFAQKDPAKYAEVAKAMQDELPKLQQNVNDMDSLCKFYDEWTEKMK